MRAGAIADQAARRGRVYRPGSQSNAGSVEASVKEC